MPGWQGPVLSLMKNSISLFYNGGKGEPYTGEVCSLRYSLGVTPTSFLN